MALAACESGPPPTAPEAPAGEGTTLVTSAGLVVHELDHPDPQAVVDYWTPERMRSARPVDLPRAIRPPRAALDAHWGFKAKDRTGFLTAQEVARQPHSSIGKVFFNLFGFNFVCSASAVTTEGRWGEGSRNLVVTAGHCLNDGDGVFASQWVFVPGYHEGNAPFGVWSASRLFTTSEWNTSLGLGFSRDVGFALMNEGVGEYAGSQLHDVVDPLGIIFTKRYPQDGIPLAVKPRKNTWYASFGYGVVNWGGENQVRSLGPVVALDPNFSPSPMAIPSTNTGGASGGPWLYNYVPVPRHTALRSVVNAVNSVNAYKYHGIDQMYGPQFDDRIHDLWMFAATWE